MPSHHESSPQPGLIRLVQCISRGDKDSLAEQDEFELSGDFEKQWYRGFEFPPPARVYISRFVAKYFMAAFFIVG